MKYLIWKRYLFQLSFGIAFLMLVLLPGVTKAEGYDSISVIEYYFDQDPGIGNGVILVSDSSPAYVADEVIDISSLPDGIHTIWFRTQDNNGLWGAPSGKSFFVYRTLETDSVNVPVANLEYAFDNNAFASLGAITQDTSVTLATNLDMAGLSDPGIHTVWFRAKDSHPHSSAIASKSFYVYRTLETDSVNVPVANLEYAFDNNAFASLGAIRQDTSVTLATNLAMAGLSDPGIHTVWFRAKDTHPHSSSIASKSFFVYHTTENDSANIPVVSIEYSFDSITAFVPINVATPDTSIMVNEILSVSNLIGHGDHTYTMRAKNANNVWGNMVTGLFSVENEEPLANAGKDIYAGDNTLVSLDGTSSSDLNHDELDYFWTPPSGIVLSSTTDATPTFTAPSIVADTNLVFILYVNDGLIDSPIDTIIVRVIHNSIDINDTIIGTGINECINAFSTIIVAGDGGTVTYDIGSSQTLIAGQLIRFLPGFHAMRGSDMIAYIEDGNGFCDKAVAGSMIYQPPVEKSLISTLVDKRSTVSASKQVKIYPNPSDGRLVVELKNYEGTSKVTVVNSLGVTMFRTEVIENELAQLDLSLLSKGVYFVQIRNQKDITTEKLIVK